MSQASRIREEDRKALLLRLPADQPNRRLVARNALRMEHPPHRRVEWMPRWSRKVPPAKYTTTLHMDQSQKEFRYSFLLRAWKWFAGFLGGKKRPLHG